MINARIVGAVFVAGFRVLMVISSADVVVFVKLEIPICTEGCVESTNYVGDTYCCNTVHS